VTEALLFLLGSVVGAALYAMGYRDGRTERIRWTDVARRLRSALDWAERDRPKSERMRR
jgi:hypothetical protein